MNGARTLPPSVGVKIRKTIPATSTLAVDTISGSSFRGLRYFLSAWNGSKVKALDVSAVNENGILGEAVHGKLGTLPLSVSIGLSGSDTILDIGNPNTFEVTVEVIRFLTGK